MSFQSRYDKLSVLGDGAFGTAYLVVPKGEPRVRQVAKEVRISHLSDDQRRAALAESEVLKMMKHFNIVAHIDTFMDGPRLYIVMEYADGGDLAVKIKERKAEAGKAAHPFQEKEIMFLFVQLALALQHIHALHVLHRDLKPLNIFLTRQGIVKLGDFGIARLIENSVGAQTMIGTPSYLSPEMCNSEPYGTKSDLWSLGVVTYEMAALRVPFQGASLPAVVLQIIGAEPDALPDTYSKDLSWIVFSFLDKNPSKRPLLDKVLCLPFVQQYIQMNLSHTMQQRSGGCEPSRTAGKVHDASLEGAEPTVVRVRRREGKTACRSFADAPVDTPTLTSDRLRQADALARGVAHSRRGDDESECNSVGHSPSRGSAASAASRDDRWEERRDRWEERRQEARNANDGGRERLQHDGRHMGAAVSPFPEVPHFGVARLGGGVAHALGCAGGRSRSQPKLRGPTHDPAAVEDYHRQFCSDRQASIEQEFFRNRQAAAETKRRAEAAGLEIVKVASRHKPGLSRQPSESALEDSERHKTEVKRRGQEERQQLEQARLRELDRARREAAEDQARVQRRILERQELQGCRDGDDHARCSSDNGCKSEGSGAADFAAPAVQETSAELWGNGGCRDISGIGAGGCGDGCEVDSRQPVEFVIHVSGGRVRPKPKLSSEMRSKRDQSTLCGSNPDLASSTAIAEDGGRGRRPPKLPGSASIAEGPEGRGPLRAAGSPASWLREGRGYGCGEEAGDPPMESEAVRRVPTRVAMQLEPDVVEIPASEDDVGSQGDITQLQDALARALRGVEGQEAPARTEAAVPEEAIKQSLYSWRSKTCEPSPC